MSGTAAVPNTFATAVTATGAQLDANYSTIVAYLNDPTNRNNFATDAGTTNTVVLTFSPPLAGGYTTGLEITFKAGFTNSGGVVVNGNGLGNVALVNSDGSALASAAITIGSTYKAVYDGTRFVGIGFASVGSAATQAQMEAASSIINFVTPGRQQFHPLSPKAWALLNGTATGTITTTVGYGVSTHIRLGTGTYAVGLTNAFSSTEYAVLTTSYSGNTIANILGRSTATVTVVCLVASGATAVDTAFLSFAAFGDLP